LVYLPVFLIVSFLAGARIKFILFVLFTGAIFIVFSVIPYIPKFLYPDRDMIFIELISEKRLLLYSLIILGAISIISFIGSRVFKRNYFKWITYFSSSIFLGTASALAARILLKDYQIMRLIIFLKPEVDPRGAGWNFIQSITAVGSGGFAGKGYLQGTQSHYQYLPQQSTDFIFSIIAEEWGFIGAFFVFLIITVVLMRIILIISNTKDRFAVYCGAGIFGMIFFHFIINIGMAVGIMPITGIPLIFLSYGGSSLWTGLIGIGIILSINRKKETM
jgi:rod shape determining protein RodA